MRTTLLRTLHKKVCRKSKRKSALFIDHFLFYKPHPCRALWSWLLTNSHILALGNLCRFFPPFQDMFCHPFTKVFQVIHTLFLAAPFVFSMSGECHTFHVAFSYYSSKKFQRSYFFFSFQVNVLFYVHILLKISSSFKDTVPGIFNILFL